MVWAPLRRLELAVDDLPLLDPDGLGRPGGVAAGNVGILEAPELQLGAVLHGDVPVGHLTAQEDLLRDPVGRCRVIFERVAAEGVEFQRDRKSAGK